MSKTLTPKTINALKHLSGTTQDDTRSAKALAFLLWPKKMEQYFTSQKRGGMYRAAGAYYSRLQKAGLVGHWCNNFRHGYYITQAGIAAIQAESMLHEALAKTNKSRTK